MLFFTQAINLAEAEFSPFALPDAPHGIDNGCTSSFGRSSSLFFNGKNARPFSGASDGTTPKCYKSTTCFFAGRSTTMKKSLTALAVIGAFVGSAMAADVQLYGIVDTGASASRARKSSATASRSVSSLKTVLIPTPAPTPPTSSTVKLASSFRALSVRLAWAVSGPSTTASPPGRRWV